MKMKKLLCALLAGLMLIGTVACADVDDPAGETETKKNETSASTSAQPNETTSGTTAGTDAETTDGTTDSTPADSSAGTTGETNAENDSGTSADTGVVTEIETSAADFACDLPDDYRVEGKSEINIIYTKTDYTADELIPAEVGGQVAEAVHARNIAVEEQLGVELKFFPELSSTDVNNKVNQDILSNSGDFELVSSGTYLSVLPAMEGKYVNLSNLSNINTAKRYWTQGYNDMVTFTDEDMQFLVSGPAAITMFRLMYLTLYNKQLFQDYQIDDLYDVVMDGRWTLDYQYGISTGHYLDKDGNNSPDENDFFGFVTGDIISVDPYVVAADIHLIAKDPETADLIFNAEDLDRLSDLCDKVQKLYNDQGTYVYKTADKDDVPKTEIITHFNSERAMMVTTLFWQMEHNFDALANLTYGIAPIPKFDEMQPDYHSYVQDQVTCFGISAVVSDPVRQNELAAVLELLAYHSYKLVRPAYYETALSERYMQDPQSSEILDLIFDTLDFDFSSSCSNIFTGSVIRDTLRPLLSGTTNTIASQTKGWATRYNRQLDKQFNPKLEALKSK